MNAEIILLASILVAGFYMSWNIGANDVANAIGTSVGSGALRLRSAVILAAILEFAGAFLFGSYVSGTIQSGIVDPQIFTTTPIIYVYGMFAALLSAGLWLQLASYFGWPVSTTHSIIGAVVGFGLIAGGMEAIHWDQVGYIVMSWIISPLAGGLLSFATFNFLRNRIFFTSQPIRSAKKLTPILVFAIVSLMSMMLILNGLKNVNLQISFIQSLGVSLTIALIAASIARLLVMRIPETQTSTISFNPEVKLALDKAHKNLLRVQASCNQEMIAKTTVLIDELKELKEAYQKELPTTHAYSEYSIVEKIFGYLQIISVCIMAFAHGANDVANAIGPLAAAITVLQTSAIPNIFHIPVWTLALGGGGIIIGLATWGWRVVETIGKKITELTPTRGFSAELGASATIVIASRLGLPISTTHTLVGAVIGVALARGLDALDLSKTRDIVISWMVTVPAGAGLAVCLFYLIQTLFG